MRHQIAYRFQHVWLACELVEGINGGLSKKVLTTVQCWRFSIPTGGTYSVKGSFAAPLAASSWAPSKMPSGEVVGALAGALVEAPALRVHPVGQEGWELSPSTSWGVALVGGPPSATTSS